MIQIATSFAPGEPRIAIWKLTGKLDTAGAKVLEDAFAGQPEGDTVPKGLESAESLVFDMTRVEYLSSGGLRALLLAFRAMHERGGTLALANVQPYCRKVMVMTGFNRTLPLFPSVAEAVASCLQLAREREALAGWDRLESADIGCGRVRIIPGSRDPGVALVLGNVRDILYADVTEADVRSRRFSETEYSIGCGGLGDRIDDYFEVMGEMITIGGTMVWLPTDGNDTPDFLIPETDTGEIEVRTVFNVTLRSGFNELMYFESADARGTPFDALYRGLFELAKARRPDFRGVLALAMRAELGAVYGSGVKKSPVATLKPENGEMIMHPSNLKEWVEVDEAPRHTDVTALACGIGADLTADLSAFSQDELNAVFYLHPSNTGHKSELLHNHGVIFSRLPMPDRSANLEKEIAATVRSGDFVDMRHFLDATTVKQALIGLSYVQRFERDPQGTVPHERRAV